MSSTVREPCQVVPTVSPAKHLAIRQIQRAELPAEYSSTPGGTIYSTTPGGTRIIYDRAFLMQCRESPVAKTPPTNLPMIPGVTCPRKHEKGPKPASPLSTSPAKGSQPKQKSPVHKTSHNDDPQFEMDL